MSISLILREESRRGETMPEDIPCVRYYRQKFLKKTPLLVTLRKIARTYVPRIVTPTTFCNGNGIVLTLNKTSLCSLGPRKQVLIKYQRLPWQVFRTRVAARRISDKSKAILMLKLTYINYDI